MDPIQTIQAVLNTLGIIEVKGRENLNALLGCFIALEGLLKNLTAPTERTEEAKHE